MNAREFLREIEPIARSRPLQAYVQYEAGEQEAALRYWAESIGGDDDRALRALRSLAVHHHRHAYALEVAGEGTQALQHWSKAMPLWARLLQTRTFRASLPQFSTVSSSISLQPGDLDPMVELLCECLLSPHVSLATLAVDRKEWKIATAHIEIIRTSGVPPGTIAAALDRIREQVCPLTHEPIIHTTFDEPTAAAREVRAGFAREHLRERPDGALEMLAVVVWRALKAAETSEGIEAAWKRLRDRNFADRLNELEAARDAESDVVVVHLIRTRLREVADAACRLHIAQVIDGVRARQRLVDRTNEQLERAFTAFDRRRVADVAFNDCQRLLDEMEAGYAFCQKLAARFGEGSDMATLRDVRETLGEKLRADLGTLREMKDSR